MRCSSSLSPATLVPPARSISSWTVLLRPAVSSGLGPHEVHVRLSLSFAEGGLALHRIQFLLGNSEEFGSSILVPVSSPRAVIFAVNVAKRSMKTPKTGIPFSSRAAMDSS